MSWLPRDCFDNRFAPHGKQESEFSGCCAHWVSVVWGLLPHWPDQHFGYCMPTLQNKSKHQMRKHNTETTKCGKFNYDQLLGCWRTRFSVFTTSRHSFAKLALELDIQHDISTISCDLYLNIVWRISWTTYAQATAPIHFSVYLRVLFCFVKKLLSNEGWLC